jgi:NAD(P)-dependent dehydrogenase (short-subunit alcohol dehydrogenase family)
VAAGNRVAGVDRDREPLEALASSAREQGKAAELLTIQADLTSDSAADDITKATRARFGRIDILVNNAGIGPGSIRPDSWQRPLKFWEITSDQWRRFVAVHTTAPLALANAVVPEMMRQGWGPIVNVTTSLGTMLRTPVPQPTGYPRPRSRRSARSWRRTSTAPASRSTCWSPAGYRHSDNL